MQLKRLLYSTALRLAKIEGDRPRSTQVFGMSEAGECSRVIYLRRLKPEERKYDSNLKKAQVMMLLNDGRYHQAAISEYIKQTPGVKITNIEHSYTITRTIEVGGKKYTYFLTGHPDGKLTFIKEKKTLILEVKAVSRFYCPKLIDHDIDSFKASTSGSVRNAIPQARMYSAAADTDGALILIKNKDNSELHECFVPRDRDAEERIFRKYDTIFERLVTSNGEIPCDYIAGDKNCAFCPYGSECGYGK